MKICICGGGSLGHVCAGIMASQEDVQVNILSGHPDQWEETVVVMDPEGKQFNAAIDRVSDIPSEVAGGQDIILLCLPGFLIEKTLREIRPFTGNAVVGSVVSSTGFFFFAHEILGENARLFGLRRSPYIARVKEYGKSASLLGYKKNLEAVLENIAEPESFRLRLEELFITPVSLLDSVYEAALSNSNPILHTARLYTLFRGREHDLFDRNILFYREWTDEASRLAIEMDKELFALLDKLGVRTLPTLLDYYECPDASALTRKISSIPAFQSILSPMTEFDGGWRVDYQSRYFTEDFPFGLRWIRDLAEKNRVDTPVIDKVYSWGVGMA